MSRVGIIGAGPAGLTAALELARRGHEVELFEAAPHVGGMARTLTLWDHRVDIGPHRFFTRDEKVDQFWKGIVGEDYDVVDRMTRIYFGGRFYDYPLRPTNALRNMGMRNALTSLLSYTREKVAPTAHSPPESFEDWVVTAFGRRLFEMFFRDYSEKLWGIPCNELDADFAAQRIKKFSLAGALLHVAGLSRESHATLVDRFHYPKSGTGMVYERMAAEFRERGGKLHLNTPVSGIGEGGRRLQLGDGEERAYDRLISTMPLTLLCRSLPNLPPEVEQACDRLIFRNTILVYLLVDGDGLFPDQWLYIQSPELRLGRVTNFQNWSAGIRGPAGQTVLALEYWCFAEDAIWSDDDGELIRLATGELQTTGLLGGANVLEGKVVRVAKCYPVYRRGYREHLGTMIGFLRETAPQVSAIGRYGAFKYNNQDHSILMGLLAAENAGHDLWGVNTDYGVYQEQRNNPTPS